jgi:hypothetical protein
MLTKKKRRNITFITLGKKEVEKRDREIETEIVRKMD